MARIHHPRHCEEGALCPTKQSLFCVVLLLTVVLSSCSSNRAKLAYTDSAAHNWLTSRANPANTGAVDATLVNSAYTIAWRTKTGGVASCEPVVRDGLLFFCGLDRRVEVFDLATGERRFRKRFDGPVLGVLPGDSTFGVLVDEEERRYFVFELRTAKARSSFRMIDASAPPRQLTDSTILFVTWRGIVKSITNDGRKIWEADCEGIIQSSPAITDSTVYVAAGHSIYALDVTTGNKRWEHGVSGAIEGAPAVDDKVYFGAIDSIAAALDIKSGDLIWSASIDGGIHSTPTVGESMIYVAGNNGLITALDKSNGQSRWTYNTEAIANLSPTLSGDYLLTTSRQPVVRVLSATTGERLWSDTTLAAQATTSPLVVGDRIILTDAKRNLICLAPAIAQSANAKRSPLSNRLPN